MRRLPFEERLLYRHFLRRRKTALPRKFPSYSIEQLLNWSVINLDKPKGPKSIRVVNRVREILKVRRIGHAGTLDPIATGVLPIGIGKGTRILSIFSLAGKVYQGNMYLHKRIAKQTLLDNIKDFTGEIVQLPPRISAVARKPRKRIVYWFKILSFDGKNARFEIGCQHGTYIRKLIHDLGQRIGCGAHMTELRRIQAGPFKIQDAITIEQLERAYVRYKAGQEQPLKMCLISLDRAAAHLPRIYIPDDVIERFKHGSPIFCPGIVALTSDIKKGDVVAIYDLRNKLLGLGIAEADAEDIRTKPKGLAIRTDVVLI